MGFQRQGNLQVALREFRSAYQLRPDRWVLLSIARVLHRLSKTEEALDAYRRYLSKTKAPPPSSLADAEQRIARLNDGEPSDEPMPTRSDGATPSGSIPSSRWTSVGIKPGQVLLDLGAGASMAYSYGPMVAVSVKLGVIVTSDKNGYLIFPIHADLGPDLSTYFMTFGIGFQYDVRLSDRLYLTPQVSAGPMISIQEMPHGGSSCSFYGGSCSELGVSFFGVGLTPEVGLKYVLGRANLSLDALSLPLVLYPPIFFYTYRLLGTIGVNF
jgi:hypothetical protein